ncbi:unnamed protein product [Cylicostephanus goldi]|uniref:Uncharacterized protein n=1 Tax=Cylicostephanus goldi TaxID=71465 RepID=A0A3P6RP30_CYLGO|nr:unnamed protein product [Cylicostephanus goldi]
MLAKCHQAVGRESRQGLLCAKLREAKLCPAIITSSVTAIVCVTLLNRMKGDQVVIDHDQYIEFEERPFRLVTALIKKQLGYA